MNNNDETNPLSSLFDKLEESMRRREKITDRAEMMRNETLQSLRMDLTAKLDDPTHPLTESEFAHSIAAALVIFETVGTEVKPLHRTGVLAVLSAVKSMAERTASFIASNDCGCAECKGGAQ